MSKHLELRTPGRSVELGEVSEQLPHLPSLTPQFGIILDRWLVDAGAWNSPSQSGKLPHLSSRSHPCRYGAPICHIDSDPLSAGCLISLLLQG